MPPKNPMTEGEALAVDYSSLARDVARTLQKAGAPLTEDQILLLAGSLAVYVEAALNAAQQPGQEGGGEVTPYGVARASSSGVAALLARNGVLESANRNMRFMAAPPSAPVGVEQETERVKNLRAIATEAEHLSEAAARACDDVEKEHQACRAIAARNLITQQPAQAAPGWKLVPVEPTDTMLREIHGLYDLAARRYAAMLAAAPTPPGDDAAGGGLHG